MNIPERQRELFLRYANKTATQAEVRELMDWIAEHAGDEELAQLMEETWDTLPYHHKVFDTATSNRMLQQALNTAPQQAVPLQKRRITFGWKRMAAAASILLMLSAGFWFLTDKSSNSDPSTRQNTEAVPKNDIAPAKDKAILTLADGSQIILDDAANGALPAQGAQVIKLDGELRYNNTPLSATRSVHYNTISTAKGKQYMLVLSDGSKVWLNAASSLRFPVAFTATDRRVEINGEAYFEVAHQVNKEGKKIPFHVAIRTPAGNAGEIEVLGTHFNVSAYDDEPTIKTTLLEGAVAVKLSNRLQRLSPGQQASLPHPSSLQGNAITLVENANVTQAVAWKNNLFDFDNETLQDVMRQLSRWYDIDVTYEGPLPIKHYFGAVRRQVNISEVFHMLEIAGGIDFRIEGKKVLIRAK